MANKQERRRKLEARVKLINAKPEPVMLPVMTAETLVYEGYAIRVSPRTWRQTENNRWGYSKYIAAPEHLYGS